MTISNAKNLHVDGDRESERIQKDHKVSACLRQKQNKKFFFLVHVLTIGESSSEKCSRSIII